MLDSTDVKSPRLRNSSRQNGSPILADGNRHSGGGGHRGARLVSDTALVEPSTFLPRLEPWISTRPQDWDEPARRWLFGTRPVGLTGDQSGLEAGAVRLQTHGLAGRGSRRCGPIGG
jgi:hypothetical protein